MRLLLTLAIATTAFAEVQSHSAQFGTTMLRYKVVLPTGYDPAKEYPGVLAFPGGPQTTQMVDGLIQRNFRSEAEKRGYIVIVPEAPNGDLFFEGGERVFPDFLKKILADYKIRGKLHMAGVSNGGISAFHVAALYPAYFVSITGLPGYLPAPSEARLNAISKMCIHMYVGELDTGWLQEMKDQANNVFRKRGMKVTFSVEKGQEHIMGTVSGAGAARLFDQFEQSKAGCAK